MGKESCHSVQRPSYQMPKKSIPTGGAKSVELSLHDLGGREVLLKKNVIFSSKTSPYFVMEG